MSGAISFTTDTPVVFDTTAAGLAELRTKYGGITSETAQTTVGYKMVVAAIADCRDRRVAVEKRRKELKADALAYGKMVDSRAKDITLALEAIEEPLKKIRYEIDDAKAAEKRAQEELERLRIVTEERKRRESEEAEAARVKAEKDAAEAAEREKVRLEQEAEAARLAEERKKLDAERAAAEAEQQKQRDALAAQQREIEAERQRMAAIEAKRLADEAEATRRFEAEEQAAAALARADELRPDAEKLVSWVNALSEVEYPDLTSEDAQAVLHQAADDLEALAARVFAYCDPLMGIPA